MELRELIWALSAIAAWAALMVGGINYRRSKKTEKTKIYLELRKRYLDVRAKVPDRYFGCEEHITGANPDWKYLEQYWYQGFDEWYSTNQLSTAECEDLWKDYFRLAIQQTLSHRTMRQVLVEMLDGKVSFGHHRQAFRDEMNRLWLEIDEHNRPLEDSLKPVAAEAECPSCAEPATSTSG